MLRGGLSRDMGKEKLPASRENEPEESMSKLVTESDCSWCSLSVSRFEEG
jgi:hypothetical protein